jgi:hypothetical protein
MVKLRKLYILDYIDSNKMFLWFDYLVRWSVCVGNILNILLDVDCVLTNT